MITVISLGGSIIAPGKVDEQFLSGFVSLIRELLEADEKRRFIFVTGGGSPARTWQTAYRNISVGGSNDQADWIGVMATRLNAQLIKAVMGDYCTQDVVTDPSRAEPLAGRVLVAAGWKPGFSSDYDAVLLAERFQADKVINLSNIERVYTDDPRKNPDAKPIDRISWEDFRVLVGDEWTPGKNAPFDPVASRHAAAIGLQV
ncbi:MAG: UMP kinase, partial [Treponema sp.]|nr:UMP kinase [Treponema sp.]